MPPPTEEATAVPPYPYHRAPQFHGLHVQIQRHGLARHGANVVRDGRDPNHGRVPRVDVAYERGRRAEGRQWVGSSAVDDVVDNADGDAGERFDDERVGGAREGGVPNTSADDCGTGT